MPVDPNPGGEPTPINQPARRVPAEEINWKKRALDAEAALASAQAEVAALTERCATHEKNLQSIARAKQEADRAAARERTIAEALGPHNPIDATLCATLLERDLAPDADGPALTESIGPLVARLASERPYLFRAAATPPATLGATMAGEPGAPAHSSIDDAMEEARASGDRTQLLRYLRLRRGA